MSHSNDVDKVVLSQCIQNGVDGVFGNGHLQSLHTATNVHHDDDVFGRRGSLDVPVHRKWRQPMAVGINNIGPNSTE